MYSYSLQMIDEFTDVNDGEKKLMKLWNIHVMERGWEKNSDTGSKINNLLHVIFRTSNHLQFLFAPECLHWHKYIYTDCSTSKNVVTRWRKYERVCSWSQPVPNIASGCCNIVVNRVEQCCAPTLFTVVNNVERYCYTLFRLNNIVQCCWQVWRTWAGTTLFNPVYNNIATTRCNIGHWLTPWANTLIFAQHCSIQFLRR